MNSLRAKFKVGSVTDFANNNFEIKMTVVVNDCPENKEWSMYTPSGDARLHITNPAAAGFFKPGKNYIATFVECDDTQH